MRIHPKQLDLSHDLQFTGGDIRLAEGRILVGNGSETSPAIAFSEDLGTGIFLANPGEIAISAGANAFVYLKDDGTVEMTGTTGLALQAGSTSERPETPLDGIIRYNLDNDTHETYVNGSWTDFIFESDARLNPFHIMEVRKNPGKNQFATIQAALAAVVNPSINNRYHIDVGPGIFLEPTLVVPSYVQVCGSSPATVVQASAANQHLFNLSVWSSVGNMRVTGVSGAGFAAFYIHSPSTTTTGSVLLKEIIYGANNTQVLVQQDIGTVCSVFSEGGHIGAYGSFDQGFIAIGPGTARINVRSLTTNGTSSPAPTVLFKADGPLTTVLSTGSLFRNSVGTSGTGIHLKNGATGRFVGVSLLGFAKAIWLENDGTGPIFNGDAINLQQNTMDLQVDHPGSTGHFLGCAQRNRVFVDESVAMSIFYSDPANTGITSVGPIYLGPTHSKTTEMSGLFNQATTMGVLTGGTLTKSATAGSVDIAAGYGYASISDPISRTARISWPNTTLAIPADTTVYIYFTNVGVVAYSASIPNLFDNIVLGRVTTDGTIVAWIDPIPSSASHASNHIEMMLRGAFGTVYASGSIVTQGSTPFSLNVSGGSYFYGSLRFNPIGAASVPLSLVYHNGANDFTFVNGTLVPHDKYDNGTGLVNLTSGYYVKHTLYIAGDGPNESYLLVYGQAQYATLVQAEAAALPLPPSSFIGGVTSPIASIIVQQGATTITEIFDIRPTIGAAAPTLSAASNHSNLLGLNNDDHQQYLLVNGNRAMAGQLDMASHAIANVTTINNVSISTHAARHLPNGADPITSAAAVGLSLATTNAVGTANSFARSDHTHTITGVQAENANLTSLSGITTQGSLHLTTTGTLVSRTLTGTAGRIVVTNGNGVSGNPVIDLSPGNATPGTYDRVSVDTYGRVFGGLLDTDTWTASALETPTTSTNYPVLNAAPATLDTTYTSLIIRAFDDARSEGVGITTFIPAGASNLRIQLIARARTAPSTTQVAMIGIHARRYPVNAAPPAWSTVFSLLNASVPQGNALFQSYETTFVISGIGLVANETCQIEIIRIGANAIDTLVGDFHVASIRLDWT